VDTFGWIRQDARYVSDDVPKRVISNGVRFALCDGNDANGALARTCATGRGRVFPSGGAWGQQVVFVRLHPWPSPGVATESRSHRLGAPSLNGASGGTLLSAAIAMMSLELRLQGTAMAVTISTPCSSAASRRWMGDRIAHGPRFTGQRPVVYWPASRCSWTGARWSTGRGPSGS
jgi:hypothetical protein